MPQAQLELSLQLQQVGSFLVNVWPLSLENLVEALRLKARLSHSEVNIGDPTADVWRKLYCWVSGG